MLAKKDQSIQYVIVRLPTVNTNHSFESQENMSFSEREGSRDFISVSMPWNISDKEDHNSKSRRQTSLYRVSHVVI